MKTRESGMPDEAMWRTFFNPEAIFDALDLTAGTGDTVDFGCGYRTFSLPAVFGAPSMASISRLR